MAKKKTASRPKRKAAKGGADSNAVGRVGAALGAFSDELGKLYHLEQIPDRLGTLAIALDTVAQAVAASVIAQHGTTEDRRQAIEHLKAWFPGDTFQDR